MSGATSLRDWGRGFCVVREDPNGDAIDIDRTEDIMAGPIFFVRVLAVCLTREAAEAALRLLTDDR